LIFGLTGGGTGVVDRPSCKFGHPTASLLIAKLHASSRQNSQARALPEYGGLVRTIYLCRYVADT